MRQTLRYLLIILVILCGEKVAALTISDQIAQVPIHPMADFNFKTKKEIYEIRKNAVAEHPELLMPDNYSAKERLTGWVNGKYSFTDSIANMTNKNYIPSEAIFGQIQDGKPWWGILGRSYYGNGQNSIQGPAEESRFILNPFLLVGLDSGYAMVISNPGIAPTPIYPVPVYLMWAADRSKAWAKYDVTTFWKGEENLGREPAHKLTMVAYNARDMGYNYLYVMPQSQNVKGSQQPAMIRQFIHTGPSCGYPGGCNNMSPHQPELEFEVNSLPAIAYIKLWKSPPPNANAPADMTFIIQMM